MTRMHLQYIITYRAYRLTIPAEAYSLNAEAIPPAAYLFPEIK